jgi:hypothetical protein
MDVHLVSLLEELGIAAETASGRGWRALSNGDLVEAAADAGFDCLLTRDQLFGESAARAMRLFPRFAVVVVGIPQQPWREYRKAFLVEWTKRRIDPAYGQLTYWP